MRFSIRAILLLVFTLSLLFAASLSFAGGGQYGNAGSNSHAAGSVVQPVAPPVAASPGPVYNNGVGVGITNGNSSNVNTTSSAASSQANSQSQSGASNANNVTLNNGNNRRIPVNTAYAAGLVASNCIGSGSAGVQGSAIGISVGKTYESQACELRNRVATLQSMGMHDAALMLLCMEDAGVREAMTATGRRCSEGGAYAANWGQPAAQAAPIAYVSQPITLPTKRAARPGKRDRN